MKRTLTVTLIVNATEHGVRLLTSEQTANYSAQMARLDQLDVLKRENADRKNAIEAYW